MRTLHVRAEQEEEEVGMVSKHTKEDLQYLQALPLNLKIRLTQQWIREWINEFGSVGIPIENTICHSCRKNVGIISRGMNDRL